MIKFGPSGRSNDMIKNVSIKSTLQVAKYIKDIGLDIFEYSFGHGARMSYKFAEEIGKEFKDNDVEISVHAPYFINFATFDEKVAINNHRHIFDSLELLQRMGGERCVFHPGSVLKNTREDAMDKLIYRINKLLVEKYDLGYESIYLCVETMGKLSQLGTLDEIIKICNLEKSIIPCVDFGHVNARANGCFFNKNDYKEFISRCIDGIGIDKVQIMHVHFSKIEFGQFGEVRHLTFEDDSYGPPYEPFIEAIYELGLTPKIICESAGTQCDDAIQMKTLYNKLLTQGDK